MEGIDVHGDKGLVDWAAVARSGVTFAFVKATEGKTFEDRLIARNLRTAREAGVLVGPYHYARPDLPGGVERALQEADFFCRVVLRSGWDKKKDARPVLDIEVGSGDLTVWALTWCRRVEQTLGVRPIVYSYTYFVRAHLTGAALAVYPLWLANYGRNDGTRYPVAPERPWTQLTIHQYTSSGRTPGVMGRCDRNYTSLGLGLLRAMDRPLPVGDPMWQWIRWWRGRGEFSEYGPRDPDVRPDVPERVPVSWWVRLALNLGHLSGGGSSPRSQ